MFRFVLWLLILLLVVPLVTGFNMMLKLQPVSGPMKESGLSQAVTACFELNKTGHGKAVLNLPNNELCSGEYTLINKDQEHNTFFNSDDFIHYYGNSFKNSNLQYGQAVVYGSKGTVVYAEFYVNFWRRYGLARDNFNNVYKL